MNLKILFIISITFAACDKCGNDLSSYKKLQKEHSVLSVQEKELITAIDAEEDDEKQLQLMDELFMLEVEMIDNEDQLQTLKDKSECI